MDRVRKWAVQIILVHLAVSTLHGLAHLQLEVHNSPLGNLYIALVITLAPLLAFWRLRLHTDTAGAWLLVLSMAGALLFGLYYHFLHESHDHVAHLPEGNPYLFQITAWLILLLETAGTLVGLWLLKHIYQPENAYER